MDTEYSNDDLEREFPNLASTYYKITSPYDLNYNCLAWAAGDNTTYWEPDPMRQYYWPRGAPRGYSVKSYCAAFEKLGFSMTSDGSYDPAFIKIAIYTKDGYFQHVARQLDNGRWTSKLGLNVDIEHDLKGIEGDEYGTVEIILKKAKLAQNP